MGEQQDIMVKDAVRSYAAWWHEAGFHTAIDPVAHSWRGEQPVPFWRQAQQRPVEARPLTTVAQAPSAVTAVATSVASARPAVMPDSLPAFLDWFAQDRGQPESGWEGALILPPAQQGARLLLIVEMPTPGATDVVSLLEAGQRRFIDAMLTSLGRPTDDVALLSMAARRPPGGVLDEETLTLLTMDDALSQPCAAKNGADPWGSDEPCLARDAMESARSWLTNG